MGNQQTGMRAALSSCGWLTAVALGLWALLLYPAFSLGASAGIEGLSYAALLCLAPGYLVFVLAALYSATGTPLAFVMLAGTGLRMLSVLLGIFVIQGARPDLGFREFTVWALVFYMAMLLAETTLALRWVSESQSANGT